MKFFVTLSFAGYFFSLSLSGICAAANKEESKEYEYPELLVAPSASQTLKEKSNEPSDSRWTAHIPLQIPALVTFVSGINASNDPGKKSDDDTTPMTKTAGLTAMGIGGGWLAFTVGLSAMYSPYKSAEKDLRKMSGDGKSKRDRLAYERRAEEGLYRPAAFASTLKWLSITSNTVANAFVLATCKNSTSLMFGGIGLITAWTPAFFPHSYEQTWRFHEDYKKRIYGSLAMDVMHDEQRQAYSPGLNLTFNF